MTLKLGVKVEELDLILTHDKWITRQTELTHMFLMFILPGCNHLYFISAVKLDTLTQKSSVAAKNSCGSILRMHSMHFKSSCFSEGGVTRLSHFK